MHLIRVGRRRLNITYLIMDEENDGTDETRHIPQGGIRVTMETGKEFTLTGADAEVYRRQINDVLCPDPDDKPLPRTPSVGHAVRRGRPEQPRVPVKRKGGS